MKKSEKSPTSENLLIILLNNDESEISIIKNGLDKKSKVIENHFLSENLLIAIFTLLDEAGVDKTEISGIGVNTLTKSYTGIRIGLATVNLIGYSLNIPVFEYKSMLIKDVHQEFKKINQRFFQEPILPQYASQPKITQPKY